VLTLSLNVELIVVGRAWNIVTGAHPLPLAQAPDVVRRQVLDAYEELGSGAGAPGSDDKQDVADVVRIAPAGDDGE
jgi:hypothetical protein